VINPFSDSGKETQNPFLDTRIRIWIFPKKRTLTYQAGSPTAVLSVYSVQTPVQDNRNSSDAEDFSSPWAFARARKHIS